MQRLEKNRYSGGLSTPWARMSTRKGEENNLQINHEGRKTDMESNLRSLVDAQNDELSRLNLSDFLSKDPTVLISAFKKTPSFRSIIMHAEDKTQGGFSSDRSVEFNTGLAGILFEGMAYHYMAAKEYPGRVVLSPERTTELYKMLYPDRKIIYFPFDRQGIGGISAPDGLIVDDTDSSPKIISLIESTTSRTTSPKFGKQYSGFLRDIAAGEANAGIFNYVSQILFIVPSDELFFLPDISWDDNVDFQQLPFTRKYWRQFVDEVSLTGSKNEITIFPPNSQQKQAAES